MKLVAKGDGEGGDDEQPIEAAVGWLPQKEEVDDREKQELHYGAEGERFFAVEEQGAAEEQEDGILDVGVEIDDESSHQGVGEALFIGASVPDQVRRRCANEQVDGHEKRSVGPAAERVDHPAQVGHEFGIGVVFGAPEKRNKRQEDGPSAAG